MISNEPCCECLKQPTFHKLDDNFYCEKCWEEMVNTLFNKVKRDNIRKISWREEEV